MSVFETERLVMRPWREDDAENLYKYASDPEVGPAAGWPVHTSVEDSLRVLREVLIEENTWAVTIKASDEPVGSIGVFRTEAPNGNGAPEIGYWIGKPFWGCGYIPEAVRALIDRCFDEGAEVLAFRGERQVAPRDREMRLQICDDEAVAADAGGHARRIVLQDNSQGVGA